VTAYMGEEPVILCRDLNGRLRAFLNLCRHRGNRVCRADRGKTKLFTCSTRLTYSTDGSRSCLGRPSATLTVTGG
jgi:phenylpropionate dioxygenase-like ring-hydroxylating dioxygenase large terminal subunit